MGQLLSEPVTTKASSSIEDKQFKVGSSAMQGWRVGMEDAHSHFIPLEEDPEASFFAVFDGHGGERVAKHVKEHLHKKITSTDAYKNGDYVTAIREGFIAMDWEMMDDPAFRIEMSGTTAICVLIKDGKLYCGNVGDSRAIASVDGAVKELSSDHKPNRRDEQSRIIEAGGWVESSRVNGNLALSRALGDFGYKNRDKPPELQVISAYPDIEEIEVTEDLEFVFVACDGIWDCKRNNKVLDFIRTRIGEGKEPTQICEELLDDCLAPYSRGVQTGTDNMTTILITFLHGKSYDDLAKRCSTLSEDQQSARKGLSLADVLDSSDDEDPPSPPPRPAHMGGGDLEETKPQVGVETSSDSVTTVEEDKGKTVPPSKGESDKEGCAMVNGSEGQVEPVDPAPSTENKGQAAESKQPYDIN